MSAYRYRTSREEDDAVVADPGAGPRQKVAARLLRIEKSILSGMLSVHTSLPSQHTSLPSQHRAYCQVCCLCTRNVSPSAPLWMIRHVTCIHHCLLIHVSTRVHVNEVCICFIACMCKVVSAAAKHVQSACIRGCCLRLKMVARVCAASSVLHSVAGQHQVLVSCS